MTTRRVPAALRPYLVGDYGEHGPAVGGHVPHLGTLGACRACHALTTRLPFGPRGRGYSVSVYVSGQPDAWQARCAAWRASR